MRLEQLKVIDFRNHRSTSIELSEKNIFCGKNASGKTSLLAALEWGLTGKAEWDKGGIIRDGAEEASVEVKINGLGTVRRTATKNGTKVEVNGKPLPSKETERELERVIGISGNALGCIIDSAQFFRLSPSERTDFLFRLGVGRTPLKRDAILDFMQNASDAARAEVLAQLPERVTADSLDSAYKCFYAARREAKKARDELANKLKTLGDGLREAELNALARGEELALELKIAIETAKRISSLKERLNADCAVVETALSAMGALPEIERVKESFRVLSQDIANIEVENIQALEMKLNELNAQVARLKERNSKVDASTLVELKRALDEASARANLYEYLVSEFEPGGLKKRILQKIIAPIEKNCNTTLLKLGDYELRFVVENNVEVLVKVNGGWVAVDSLSSSEKLRIGVALQNVISNRYNARLIAIDNVDMLDEENRRRLIEWIQEMREDWDTVLIAATDAATNWLSFDAAVYEVKNGCVQRIN